MDTIIYQDQNGNVLCVSDVKRATGKVTYKVREHINADPITCQLVRKAKKRKLEGRYEDAITWLEEAVVRQPGWAFPAYKLAYYCLLKNDPERALFYYKKTDELEPKGFYKSKTILYALQGEETGIFPEGTCLAYHDMEQKENSACKLMMALKLVQSVPDFAPAWMQLSELADDNNARLLAIEKGLSKYPDGDTEGLLLSAKAYIISSEGNNEKAIKLLANHIFSPVATKGSIERAKFTLKSILYGIQGIGE